MNKKVNECVVSELVENPDLPVRFTEEQELEESIKEEVSNIILPEMYRAEESVHKDEIKLETPEINEVEIGECLLK